MEDIIKQIKEKLKNVPIRWEGKEAILEMKNNNYPHWRQLEWVGFYFQYLCEKSLKDTMKFQSYKVGRCSFDGFYEIPWDFKVHISNDPKGKEKQFCILNDQEAMSSALKEYKKIGLILAVGKAVYNDKERSFYNWHKELKGPITSFEKERVARKAPSRLRKTIFNCEDIKVLILDENMLKEVGSPFQKNMRNSNGNKRRPKIKIDVTNIKQLK